MRKIFTILLLLTLFSSAYAGGKSPGYFGKKVYVSFNTKFALSFIKYMKPKTESIYTFERVHLHLAYQGEIGLLLNRKQSLALRYVKDPSWLAIHGNYYIAGDYLFDVQKVFLVYKKYANQNLVLSGFHWKFGLGYAWARAPETVNLTYYNYDQGTYNILPDEEGTYIYQNIGKLNSEYNENFYSSSVLMNFGLGWSTPLTRWLVFEFSVEHTWRFGWGNYHSGSYSVDYREFGRYESYRYFDPSEEAIHNMYEFHLKKNQRTKNLLSFDLGFVIPF